MAGTTIEAPSGNTRLREREERHSFGFAKKRDIALVRGQGARVWDADGRAYVDCTAGHGVAAVGHAHPRIAAAVAQQAATLITCQDAMPNDVRARFVERLVEFLPPGLERVFLCNSGTEAVEAAIKLARLSTGRTGVVAATGAFHGRTLGALSATWRPEFRAGVEPLVPEFRHVPFGDLAPLEEALGDGPAALILEVVQGEGGVHALSGDYLVAARELCDRHEVLLVLDEVQTGFGRTGHRFACEAHGVTPDLICLGKAIAGGLPMGAVAAGSRVAPPRAGSHGSTFGGNPLACAAGLATLDVFEDERLVERAAELGAWWMQRLRAIEHRAIAEVRGAGLMVAVEFRMRVAPLIDALADRGVLALSAGPRVLRFLPPLVVERGELEQVAQALESVLAALDAGELR
ncbi:MAG: acetylornithine/succinylornithine family transaminase [Planctomycetes bacterium]|nr:acetylornithine/succinylornithine family transaminase [Planctomycetota bacterium]MCB9904437.1 acetylornithine/succinylornithine family transaminase [Planctomycetota bacterium]